MEMLYNTDNTALLVGEPISEMEVGDVFLDIYNRRLRNLFVSSKGGDATAVMVGIDYLLPRKLTVIGGSLVTSAAFDVFLCGARRVALPNSIFGFHEARMEYEGRIMYEAEIRLKLEIALRTKQDDVAKHFSMLLYMFSVVNNMTERLLIERTKIRQPRELMLGDGIVMDAREAKAYGVVHEIISGDRVIF